LLIGMADVFWGYTHRRRRRKPATKEHLTCPFWEAMMCRFGN